MKRIKCVERHSPLLLNNQNQTTMYKFKQKLSKTTITPPRIKREGTTIEQDVRKLMSQKEPIGKGVPLIFTERKDGVNRAYDIRTNRWEVAVEAMDVATKQHVAKRESAGKATDQTQAGGEGGEVNTVME